MKVRLTEGFQLNGSMISERWVTVDLTNFDKVRTNLCRINNGNIAKVLQRKIKKSDSHLRSRLVAVDYD